MPLVITVPPLSPGNGILVNAGIISLDTTVAVDQTTVQTLSNKSIALSSNSVAGLSTSATTDTTNATNITSGTLADGRLSSNIPLLNGNNTFTGGLTSTVVPNIQITDSVVNNTTIAQTYYHKHLSGTPTTNYGVGLDFFGDSATVSNRSMGRLYWKWTSASDASRNSKFAIQTVHLGVMADAVTIDTSGNISTAGLLQGGSLSVTGNAQAGIFLAGNNNGFEMSDLAQSGNNFIIGNSDTLTANRTMNLALNDQNMTLSMNGNLTFASTFTTAGANPLTFTTTGTTSMTIPSGTDILATLGTVQTFTATKTFNGTGVSGYNAFAVGGAASSATMGTNPIAYIKRTDVPSGVTAALEVDYVGTFTNVTTGFAIIGSMVDNSSDALTAAHRGGIIGIAANTVNGNIPILNEMRIDNYGTANSDISVALSLIANKVMLPGSQSGRTNVAMSILMENYSDTIGGTPLASATQIGIEMYTPTGGDLTNTYLLFGNAHCKIFTADSITSSSTLHGGNSITISHDDTNGIVTTSVGKLRLTGTSGNYEAAGTAGVDARISGLLAATTNATGVASVSTTPTTLMSYVLSANTLVSNGDSVRVRVDIQYANNTNNKTVSLVLGSTTIYNLGPAAIQSGWLTIYATITRIGASSELISVNPLIQTVTVTAPGSSTITASENLTTNLTIKVVGTGVATNDLIQYRQEVEYWPAP